MSKNNRVSIRYNDNDYKLLISLAANTGLSVSEYVRAKSLRKHMIVNYSEVNIDTYRILFRIAESLQNIQNNINRAICKGERIPQGLEWGILEELQKQIREIRREIVFGNKTEADSQHSK